MTYDELEEQYYIVSQRNSDLEREINSLVLRNTELESTNIILETSLDRASRTTENMANDLQEEVLKVVNLKVQIESLEEKSKLNKSDLVRSAVEKDSQILQVYANMLDKNPTNLPRNSIHLPMQEFNVPREQTSLILRATDTFGVYQQHDPRNMDREWHAYAKMGDRVVRYATRESMLNLNRREDFAVTLNQMVDGLKEGIIDEYIKSEFR